MIKIIEIPQRTIKYQRQLIYVVYVYNEIKIPKKCFMRTHRGSVFFKRDEI